MSVEIKFLEWLKSVLFKMNHFTAKGVYPLRIHKGKALLRFELNKNRNSEHRIRLTAVAAKEDMKGKQPDKGQIKYDYDTAINIDLSTLDCFKIIQLMELFLKGQLGKFLASAKSNRLETRIYHDSNKSGSVGSKAIEIAPKDGDWTSLFFRVKLLDDKGKDAARHVIVIDYFEACMIIETLRNMAMGINGYNNMPLENIYSGDLTKFAPVNTQPGKNKDSNVASFPTGNQANG